MSIATQEKIADVVQNVRQMVTEAVDKVRHIIRWLFPSKGVL